MTAITTTGMAAAIWPMRPPMANSGRNAAIVVSDAAVTGANMRSAPSSAACRGLAPASRRAAACSPTTIVSSTMRPTVMISANRVIMLMVSPSNNITPNAAMKAVGIPAATQNAVRPLRNNREYRRHENEPADRVVQQDLDALCDQSGLGIILLDTQLRRVVLARPVQIAIDDLSDLESIGGGSIAEHAVRLPIPRCAVRSGALSSNVSDTDAMSLR